MAQRRPNLASSAPSTGDRRSAVSGPQPSPPSPSSPLKGISSKAVCSCRLGLTLILVLQSLQGCLATCTFPSYLRAPLSDGSDRYWITQSKYSGGTSQWESQVEITVKQSEIVAKIKFEAECTDYGDNTPCYHREVVHRRRCIRDEDGKYRVLHKDNGRTYYTCIKFVQRNKNVVQLWSGGYEDNEDGLCTDYFLQRDEWPWIAAEQTEWSTCPINGGYDFKAFLPSSKEKYCPEQWRPSRFESECIQGEGILLTYPAALCSPFADHRIDATLQCWASWEEESYIFMLAAEEGKLPQFAFRFPLGVILTEEFMAHMYFSPVLPITKRGIPATHVTAKHIELRMSQSEPGFCYDESDLCSRHTSEGKCTNHALHQYANYCKRSCGVCNLLPSPRAECRFPADLRGDWILFEKDRKERVSVDTAHVTFEMLGEFICKSKHWNDNKYKMLSYYSNGCRPRYTCIRLEKDTDDTLQLQIAHSWRTDESFSMCAFRDDPPPLGGSIRSGHLKTLLRSSLTKSFTCGIGGQIKITTMPDARGRSCAGTISDWNSQSCGVESKLKLSLDGNCGIYKSSFHFEREYICVAYMEIEEGYSLLITRSSIGRDKFSCWIIKTYSERMSYRPWKEAYLLDRAQCGREEDLDISELRKATIAVRADSDRRSQPCEQSRMIPSRDKSKSKHGGRGGGGGQADAASTEQRVAGISVASGGVNGVKQRTWAVNCLSLSLCIRGVNWVMGLLHL